ncbi:MAG: BlaI/MecI/CopY family transcriptional regulator [Chthoniobacterales bacterium]
MKKQGLPRPTDSELQILQELWKLGSGTVKQVHEALGENTAYTTILKLLQIMTEKGLVNRDEALRAHIYHPVFSEDETQQSLVRGLLQKAFGGSSARLVMQALSSQSISSMDLAKIRELIQQLEERKS